MTGKVRTLNKDKKFGFIRGESQRDYFFHSSALKNAAFDSLQVGMEVTFEDSEGTKGPRAEDVFVESN